MLSDTPLFDASIDSSYDPRKTILLIFEHTEVWQVKIQWFRVWMAIFQLLDDFLYAVSSYSVQLLPSLIFVSIEC